MNQITIFASEDLDEMIVDVLHEAGAEGFVRMTGASAHRFNRQPDMPRTIIWEAHVFIVPAAADAVTEHVRTALGAYADTCSTEPCLRVVVARIEAAF